MTFLAFGISCITFARERRLTPGVEPSDAIAAGEGSGLNAVEGASGFRLSMAQVIIRGERLLEAEIESVSCDDDAAFDVSTDEHDSTSGTFDGVRRVANFGAAFDTASEVAGSTVTADDVVRLLLRVVIRLVAVDTAVFGSCEEQEVPELTLVPRRLDDLTASMLDVGSSPMLAVEDESFSSDPSSRVASGTQGSDCSTT
jgi:hypothetical protein